MSTPEGTVLVLNCGSSSVKAALVDPRTGERAATCLAERVGTPEAVVRLRPPGGAAVEESRPDDGSHRGVLAHVLPRMLSADAPLLGAGHRVVHGGERFSASVLVDEDVLAGIDEVGALAPLHNPANLAGIEAVREVLPQLPNVAVFDTAFHQTMPAHAYRYAVPEEWYAEHRVRRYGFHGTSVRYVSARAEELLREGTGAAGGAGRPPRLVVAHLGNGCSATAVLGGRSVDTTMGLTPLEGLVMGTRSGDVDPGVLAHVASATGADVHELVRQLNSASGLLGLSGLSNDVRTLVEAAEDGHAGAELALEVFTHRLAKHVAALTVPLGGLDALVLTGGIGENGVRTRSRLLARLGHLGLVEDPAANAAHGRTSTPRGRISAGGDGAPLALVVPTDEELLIARDTAALVPR